MTKSVRLFVALLALLAFASVASAAVINTYSTPEKACENNQKVINLAKTITRDGYVLQSSASQPIYYFVMPTGDFNWGTVSYTFVRPGTTETVVMACSVTSTSYGYYVSSVSLNFTVAN